MDFPILHNPLSQPPMSMQSTPPLVFPALSESSTEEEEEGEEEGAEEGGEGGGEGGGGEEGGEEAGGEEGEEDEGIFLFRIGETTKHIFIK